MKIAVFPGSFDPFTIGHKSVAERALGVFDKVVIAIGINANKKSMFTPEERKMRIEQIFEHERRIEVLTYTGLTVGLCQSLGINFIVRGLRSVADFEQESIMAKANSAMPPHPETVFFLASPAHDFISSSIARDVLSRGEEATAFLP